MYDYNNGWWEFVKHSPLLLSLIPLIIILPTFLTNSAHRQKIYQNMRLDLTRYAIIQFSRILIFVT